MYYIVKNISTDINVIPDFAKLINNKLKVFNIEEIEILKKAIDARKRNALKFVYTLKIKVSVNLPNHPDFIEYTDIVDETEIKKSLHDLHPFIIGMGPAGLFSALKLVENGFKPYLFDKGDDLSLRKEKVKLFWDEKKLDTDSNIQFGEGGAGAFSDGKLTARNRNFYSEQVFDYLIKFGADRDIKIDALPHLGTDKLEEINLNIRNYLIKAGCKFFYRHELQKISIEGNILKSVIINNIKYKPEIVILATGNSSRQIFNELFINNVPLENKPFAVGFRIEHPAEYINHLFYGKNTDFNLVGAATYKLTANYNNRGIYSFCMCPGGFVIPASSELDGQVVNGMSYSCRNNVFSNSALVVTVDKKDFGKHPLAGIDFQLKLEKDNYFNFLSPAQNAYDFVNHTRSAGINNTSNFCGCIEKDLADLVPGFISDSLKHGLSVFNKKLSFKDSSFLKKGILMSVETRTSSPVRILRDSIHYNSTGIKNLYPVGEGAGYAGGIISSATDGLKISGIFNKNQS